MSSTRTVLVLAALLLAFGHSCPTYCASLGVAVVGSNQTYLPRVEDNIWTVADKFSISALRILAANPGVSEDLGEGVGPLVIPRTHIIPRSVGRIVVDIDRRLLFVRGNSNWQGFGVSVGERGRTPVGRFTVVGQKKYPIWYPTPRQRYRDAGLPLALPPGRDNPLGVRALYLNEATYLIHGTRDDWQVGSGETDGCIELRNAHVQILGEIARAGDSVAIERFGPIVIAHDNVLYLEVGPYFLANSITRLSDAEAAQKSRELFSYLNSKSAALAGRRVRFEVDRTAVERAFKFGLGYPVAVGRERT